MLMARMWRLTQAIELRDPAEAEGDQQERDAEAEAVGEAEQQRRGRGSPRSIASAETAASVGPMHGVQPMPNTMPSSGAPSEPGARAPGRLERALQERDLADEDEPQHDQHRTADAR